jgi:hypothetical protein
MCTKLKNLSSDVSRMSVLLASFQLLIPLPLLTPLLLLASLLLLRVCETEMYAVNGLSAAVDILPLPSLLGDSAVIGVPAVACVPVFL